MEARLGIDDFVVRKACVLAGQGFTVLPMMFCETELRNGTLVQVLSDFQVSNSLEPQQIAILWPGSRRLSVKVRAVIDFFLERFGAVPYWDQS